MATTPYLSRSPQVGRPSAEIFGSSAGTAGSGSGLGLDDELRSEDDGETVESLMSKLAIERRVQYGAEKMLDVIEKRNGNGEEQDQVKVRITAQLEAANDHIKALELRLERLKGTPSRSRRRPQARLNGFASSSSIGLGSSFNSSTGLSSGSRPRVYRRGSNLTPEREEDQPMPLGGTPSRSQRSRPRSLSAGDDSFDLVAKGSSRMGWIPSGEGMAGVAASLNEALATLRALGQSGKGKGRELNEKEGEDELVRVGFLLKHIGRTTMAVDAEQVIDCVLPFLSDGSTYGKRALAYRNLRLILTRQSWGYMVNAGIEWILVRSFTRDAKGVQEKEQALRLLRAAISLPPPNRSSPRPSSRRSGGGGRSRNASGRGSRADLVNNPPGATAELGEKELDLRVPLTDGMIRAIVSVAENPDDPMRIVCMETLVEIGILDLECLVRSDAFRTILLTYKDGPSELGPAVTGLLQHLVNSPATRQLLLAGSDLETVLVGFTEEYGRIPSRQLSKHLERLQETVWNVGTLLQSWPGLIYLCMDEFRAVKSLVGSLYSPSTEVKEAVLDLFFNSLRIKSPAWTNAFLDGKRLTVYNRLRQATSALQDETTEVEAPHSLNLVDHFTAFLLCVLIQVGLFEALVVMIEDDKGPLGRRATLLLGEALQMANRTLPLRYAAQLQALPRLFSGATEFSNPNERHFALSALSSIDSLARAQTKAATEASKSRSGTMQDSLERGQRQVQQVKLRLGLQIDDRQFQQMIIDSGVLQARDHTKWDDAVITEMVEGPLLNPKRLDEAIKATKFMRRLFSFYHPLNNRFSSIKRTRPNHKWVKLGCSLISTMLVNQEGIRFLQEDKLLPQMVDCFHELDPHFGIPSALPVFARDRIENSLTYGYFEMIGVLSKHPEGLKILEKFKFFTCFYHLSEQRSRDDLMRIIIECFDYTTEAHPRIVLSKTLTSAYMETRLFATHHLGRLLQEQPSLTDWALELMTTQLYDTSMEVCDVAVMYLEEACSDPANLDKVVGLRPTLDHLGEVGHALFMRFVSTSAGFAYLDQAQYIERELETWSQERNLLYVIEAEIFVTKTLRPLQIDIIEDYWQYEGTAPTHFFGELTKTPEGCQLLRERGIVSDLAEIVRLHGMEASDQAVMTSVKSALWALGNIGSTEGGIPFLEDEEVLDVIVEIAEQSPVLTMKGTGFFVLGLISSTSMGAEVLEEYGWIATRTALGQTTGLCFPNDILRFTYIEPWIVPDNPPLYPPLPPLEGTEGEILTAIANLSNYVLAAGAMNNLKRIRSRHPRYFSMVSLFHRAARLICSNHYQAPVRRFILDLFNVPLDPETLSELVRLEQESLRLRSDSSGPLDRDKRKERELDSGYEPDVDLEMRRRSASSPGPDPSVRKPGEGGRARGLTISTVQGQGHAQIHPAKAQVDVEAAQSGGGGGGAGLGLGTISGIIGRQGGGGVSEGDRTGGGGQSHLGDDGDAEISG